MSEGTCGILLGLGRESRPRVGIFRRGGGGNKKASSRCRDEEACGARSYLSRPNRAGFSTCIPGGIGCCGFVGPVPQPLAIRYSPGCQGTILGERQRGSNPFLGNSGERGASA